MARPKGSVDKNKFSVEIQRICDGCGEFFKRIVGNKNSRFTKYCSVKCRHKSQSFRRYGLTQAVVKQMLEEQEHACCICKKELNKDNMNIDHDHKTQGVRGILCFCCNAGLGSLRDDVKILKSAIKYLEK